MSVQDTRQTVQSKWYNKWRDKGRYALALVKELGLVGKVAILTVILTLTATQPASAAGGPGIDTCTAVNLLRSFFRLITGSVNNLINAFGWGLVGLFLVIAVGASAMDKGGPWFKRTVWILFIVLAGAKLLALGDGSNTCT